MRSPLFLAAIIASLSGSAVACSSAESDVEGGDADEGALTSSDLSTRGEKQVHFPVAGRPDELCIVPAKGAGGAYTEADKKTEEKLCKMNFYATEPGEGAAICPKDSSTNPGVDVHELGDQSKEQVESGNCQTDKVAKYKQSITCSYTGSILGYYHVSRFLGGAANVPPAVIRTMDLEAHKKIVERGITATTRVDGPGFDVHDAWVQYRGLDANPRAFSRAAQVYTADFQQLYGAMQSNPSGDAKHPLLRVSGGDTGLQQFLRGAAFGVISGRQSLAEKYPRELDKDTTQGLVLAKDASDMVLLDELLSQQDRYGNIHSVAYKVFEDGGRLKKIRLKRDDRDAVIDNPAVNGVIVEQMVLRDNDCGVTKENRNAKVGVVAKLTHMSARTYKHFQWFAREITTPGSNVESFMKNESLFSPTDLQTVSRQAKSLATTLKTRCASGELVLDADLTAHLKGEVPGREACDAAEPPQVDAGSEDGPVDSHGIELVKR